MTYSIRKTLKVLTFKVFHLARHEGLSCIASRSTVLRAAQPCSDMNSPTDCSSLAGSSPSCLIEEQQKTKGDQQVSFCFWRAMRDSNPFYSFALVFPCLLYFSVCNVFSDSVQYLQWFGGVCFWQINTKINTVNPFQIWKYLGFADKVIDF